METDSPAGDLFRDGSLLRHVAPKTDFWAVPNWLNRLLIALYRLEARMLSRWDAPFGLSVVCVARVPGPVEPKGVEEGEIGP